MSPSFKAPASFDSPDSSPSEEKRRRTHHSRCRTRVRSTRHRTVTGITGVVGVTGLVTGVTGVPAATRPRSSGLHRNRPRRSDGCQSANRRERLPKLRAKRLRHLRRAPHCEQDRRAAQGHGATKVARSSSVKTSIAVPSFAGVIGRSRKRLDRLRRCRRSCIGDRVSVARAAKTGNFFFWFLDPSVSTTRGTRAVRASSRRRSHHGSVERAPEIP